MAVRASRGADRRQANLQPGQAVQTLNDRVKRVNKINLEIADWLQVRRRTPRPRRGQLGPSTARELG